MPYNKQFTFAVVVLLAIGLAIYFVLRGKSGSNGTVRMNSGVWGADKPVNCCCSCMSNTNQDQEHCPYKWMGQLPQSTCDMACYAWGMKTGCA